MITVIIERNSENEPDSRKCPECGEEYTSEDWSHDFDAIAECGKCTGCLDFCPYCEAEGDCDK